MLWSVWKKYFVIICCYWVGIFPAYSSDNDYSHVQKQGKIQEEFGEYMTSVRSKIMRTWNPPDVLEEGHTTVIFKLGKNGDVISAYINESSGNNIYDESALNAIQKASPYDEFPANTSRQYVTIKYSFDSSIVKTESIKLLVDKAEQAINYDNKQALEYINRAIQEIEGDPAAYFLYARRYKINKLLGNIEEATSDLAECKRLKKIYDIKRINTCKKALSDEETPFAYFTLANAYDLAGDYENALYNIDKAINMTELNHAYKRYRDEIITRKSH